MSRKTKKIKKIKKILKLVLGQISDVYVYFLLFYLVCLAMSYFFVRWKSFFNWPVFNFSVIIFGILTLLSGQGRGFILIKQRFISLISFLSLAIKKRSQKDYLKFGAMIIILLFALYKNISPVDFLVLAYGLISAFFIIENRLAVIISFLFLASCPVLLIFKKQLIAETMAVYGYYFLVIVAFSSFREFFKQGHKKKLSTV